MLLIPIDLFLPAAMKSLLALLIPGGRAYDITSLTPAITGDIMTRNKLSGLQRELDDLRAAKHNIKGDDLVRLAQKLGRQKIKRGKHPTYESVPFPETRAITIPGHSSIKAYTAISILDDLEGIDIQRWNEILDREERKEDERQRRKALPPATIRANSNS